MDKYTIPVNALSPSVDPTQLGFVDTAELSPLNETIGQDRAVEALEFGLRIPSAGFNVYVAGPAGTGKTSLVQDMVARLAKESPTPPDWCYVNNFHDASKPRSLSFPAARGHAFQRAMDGFITALRRDIPRVFESVKYLEAKGARLEETEKKKKALFKEFTEHSRAHGFMLEDAPMGFSLVPLHAGNPITEEELAKLPEEDQRRFAERKAETESDFREFQIRVHAIDHEAERQVRELDRQVIQNLLERHAAALEQSYRDMPAVMDYLQQVQEDILMNYKDFLPRDTPHLPFPMSELGGRSLDLTRYHVNVIVEHAAGAGAPVVMESHPTYANLIGKIERKAHLGVVFTDFTQIRAGSVLQAGGGYLMLNALDVLRQPFSWDALKRLIQTREAKIEDPGEFVGFSTAGIRPEPVPVDVKVILLGPPMLHHLLQAYEEAFPKIFKVKADFDVDVPRDAHMDLLIARFIARLCREEGLPHFSAAAVAEIIRNGMRLAERHDRLSLRFSILSDLIREAGFWARRAGHTAVTGTDVDTAVTKKRHRVNLPERRIQDEIKEGALIVDLEGEAVGQVNGLSVHQVGDYAFGRPCRITARTYVGTKGVIDIQREAALSGHIHSKGVMILAGYLAGQFASAHPFALSATLTFEQTYSEVEGDSASAAELVAILSSLGGVPVRQSLAITGSVNQLGEIQPVGGVNEKVEGFFEACQRHGLSGRQGVIIPARNINHLVLRRDVIEAVENGRFFVYGVSTVDEAVEMLTGLDAGERSPEGTYPERTVYGHVSRKLSEMARIVMERSNHGLMESNVHP
jgi:lon-related putative ATP-dependent protease